MVRVTFINALGESIELNEKFPFVLGRHTGFSSNEVVTQMSKGFKQNGSYYYGSLDNPRVLNITGYFNYSSDIEGKQRQKTIARVFNPRIGMGQVVYEDSAGKYIIDAVVSLKPVVYKIDDKKNSMARAFDVVLTCPKPDWLSYVPYSIRMNALIGGMTFALQFPTTFAESGSGAQIEYEGDNPADIVFDFRVAEGGTSMTNPKVENADGEYIEIEKVIYPGEKILLDTNPDAPNIVFVDSDGNQSDAWDLLVWGSAFFQLEHGSNVFSFSATSGDPEVFVSYREHFAGV